MMDVITGMVCQNAGVSEQQARKAIEAVMAYIINEKPKAGGEVNKMVVSSNGTSVGGFDGGTILDNYKKEFGNIVTRVV